MMTVDEFAVVWLKQLASQHETHAPQQAAIAYLLQLIAVDHTYRQMYDFNLPAPVLAEESDILTCPICGKQVPYLLHSLTLSTGREFEGCFDCHVRTGEAP